MESKFDIVVEYNFGCLVMNTVGDGMMTFDGESNLAYRSLYAGDTIPSK